MSTRTPYRKRFEDYLEAIYRIQMEKGVVRVRDLSKHLGIKPPSVIEYLKRLSKRGYVIYEKGEYIRLTPEGVKYAENMIRKHEALREFLKNILMLPDEIADRDACYIEHGVHEMTLDRIKKLMKFIDKYFPNEEKVKFLRELKKFYESSNAG